MVAVIRIIPVVHLLDLQYSCFGNEGIERGQSYDAAVDALASGTIAFFPSELLGQRVLETLCHCHDIKCV